MKLRNHMPVHGKGTFRYRSMLRPVRSMRISYRILDIVPFASKDSIITVASKQDRLTFLTFHMDHTNQRVWLFKPWADEFSPTSEERTPVGVDGEILWDMRGVAK